MRWIVGALILSSCACGDEPAATPPAPPETAPVTATTTPTPDEAPASETAVPETAYAPAATDGFALVPQEAHRTIGASFEDPDGRFSLYWSRRAVAIHEPHLGRVRHVYEHATSGDVFWAAFFPTLDPDVVLASTVAGGDIVPAYAGVVYVIHVTTGEIIETDPVGWSGAHALPPMGPGRVLAGASVIELANGRVRALDLSATEAELAERPEDVDADEYAGEVATTESLWSVLSPDRRRIAVVQRTGRITLFDAVRLVRTGVVPALSEGEGDETFERSPRAAAYVHGSDVLVMRDAEDALLVIAPDGTTTPLAVADAPETDFVLSRRGVPRIRFSSAEDGGADRVFVLETGAAVTDPIDEADWTGRAHAAPHWFGTAYVAYEDEATGEEEDEAPVPIGGWGGEHAIWSAALAPGTPALGVTAGRAGSFRWSDAGVSPVTCLAGTYGLDFTPDGLVLEEPAGECDVRTDAGAPGEPSDPEVASYPPGCVSHHGHDSAGEAIYSLGPGAARYYRPQPGVVWERITREPCGEDGVALADVADADPLADDAADLGSVVVMPAGGGTRIWDAETGEVIATIEGGADVFGTSLHGRVVFARRRRDGALILVARRGGAIRAEAGPAPDAACEPSPIVQRAGVIALHTERGVRILDARTLALRAEIDAAGTCGMELTRERILVRRGDEVLAFGLDGSAAGTVAVPPEFHATGDGTAVYRCTDGVLEVRATADGTVRGRWEGSCEDLRLSDDGRFAVVREPGRARVRFVRLADGRSLVVGMHSRAARGATVRPFAFAPATGVFWAPDDTPHELFAVRTGTDVLTAPLVTGDDAWARFRRESLVADFFAGRPLPIAGDAPSAAPPP